MIIRDRIERADEILDRFRDDLGTDARAYRNHVYRVIHFCRAFHDGDVDDREKVVIAAAFHDLGIWSDRTFDYLAPSIALAREYLHSHGLEGWSAEVESMIALHHRIRAHDDRLVEAFRRSDLTDVSLGIVRFALPRDYVREVKERFPNGGFHKRLVQLTAKWWVRHPLNPVPVLKW